MKSNQENLRNRKTADWSVLAEDSSVDSGFVINPDNESISIITDEFDPSISSEATDSEPLGHLIGRFSFFGTNMGGQQLKKEKRSLSKESKVSFDPSTDNDIFIDNPRKRPGETQTEGMFELPIDLDTPGKSYRERPGKLSGVKNDVEHELRQLEELGVREARDFTKDSRKDMTYGRRIALTLMSNKFYYPKRSTNSLTSAGKSGSLDAAASEVVKQNSTSGGPSLERAWGYFEHITLPRYISGDSMGQCCERVGLLKRRLEKAEPGELYLKSKLYDPIFTPLNQMGDFGLGFGLYFAALRSMAIITFVAGLVSIPNILFFSGPSYSNKQEGLHWSLKGSAICTDTSFVPCVDCSKDMFGQDQNRFVPGVSSDGKTLPFALKNNCDGATIGTGLSNLAAAFVIFLGMIYVSYNMRNQEIVFDEDELTIQDYSIKIMNPPPKAHDPTIWKKFFKEKFDVKVAMCTVVINNEELVQALVRRREALQKVKSILGSNELLDLKSLKKKGITESAKRNIFQKGLAKIFLSVPEFTDRISAYEEEIRELASKEDKNVIQVFISFKTEAAQRKVLSIMKTKDGIDPKYCFDDPEGKEKVFLDIDEPAEPSSIRWSDLDQSLPTVYRKLIIPMIITVGLLIACAFLVRRMKKIDSTYAAFTISILNVMFPRLAKFLTNTEVHFNEGSKQTSLYSKLALFRWVNTVVVLTLVTPFTLTIADADGNLLAGVYAIFFAEIVTSTGLQILDIGGNFKRHFLAPRAESQEEMNLCMRGTTVELAERYSNLTKIYFLGLWYSPIYPLALFFCSFSLFVNFYVDRFSMMRTWTPAPKLSSVISVINRSYFLPISIGIMAIISSYTWAQFAFDNLCPIQSLPDDYLGMWTIKSTGGSTQSIKLFIDNTLVQSYKYCNQNLLDWTNRRVVFPALPSFQPMEEQWMTDNQERISYIWGWTSVVVVGIIVLKVFNAIKNQCSRKYKARGENMNIPITDVSRINAYIPQYSSPLIPYPLIACKASEVREDFFAWSSPYYSHDHYDLTIDAEEVMKGDTKGRSVSKNAFSKVVHWMTS